MRKVFGIMAAVAVILLVASRPQRAMASEPVKPDVGFDQSLMTLTFSYSGECYCAELLYLYDNDKYPNWGVSGGSGWTADKEISDFVGDRVTESGDFRYYVICWNSSEAMTEFRGKMRGYSYAYADQADSILSQMQSEGKLVYSTGGFYYDKPEAEMQAPGNLHWSIDKDHRLLLGFDPVEGARGYIIWETDYRSDSDKAFVHNKLDMNPGSTERYDVEFDDSVVRKEFKVIAVSSDATVTAYSKPSMALSVTRDEYDTWVLNNETPDPAYKNGLVLEKDDTWSLYIDNKFCYDYNDLYNDKDRGWQLVNGGKFNPDYTELYCSPSCGWWKLTCGNVDFDYSDLYCSSLYGWWKINGGMVDFGYSDLYGSPMYGWWKIEGGTVDFAYTGLYRSRLYGMWVVKDGAVDFNANGEYESDVYGKWLVENGKAIKRIGQGEDPAMPDGLAMSSDGTWYLYLDGEIASDFNDLYCDDTYGWWKIKDGTVDFGFSDLYCSPAYGWWKIEGGTVDFGFTDLYCSPTYGWWKINGGTVDFGYNELYCSPIYGWWLVTGGAVDFGFTDLYCSPSCGWWLVTGGAVNFGYSDLFNSPTYGWWKITDGYVDFGYKGEFASPEYGTWNVSNGAVVF